MKLYEGSTDGEGCVRETARYYTGRIRWEWGGRKGGREGGGERGGGGGGGERGASEEAGV